MTYTCLLATGVFAALAMSSPVYADSTPTPPAGWSGSYKVVSPDDRFALVMLGNLCEYCFSGDDWVGKNNKLRSQYPQSGLYKNDNSCTLLWAMDYVSWQQSITLSSDGHHVVVWGPWPTQGMNYANEALTFYEDGQPLVSYTVRDLVVNPTMLPHSVSHYEWVKSSSFDSKGNLLSIYTHTGESYTFNLASGIPVSTVVPTKVVLVQQAQLTFSRPSTTAIARAKNEGNALAASPNSSVATGFFLTVSSFAGVLAGVTAISRKVRAGRQGRVVKAQKAVRRIRIVRR